MTTIGDDVGSSNAEVLAPAFAKLQGENFEYYMRKYSIMLGRNSKKKSVDIDLRKLGGGMGISRHHAHIYYDFTFRCFALEVIGRNGCIIRNFPFVPGGPPIKLNSQDLLQIGKVRFYFLLPTRSFFETLETASQTAPMLPPQLVVVPPASSNDERKGEGREGDRKESQEISHGKGRKEIGAGEGVSGLIVEFNSREIGGSCSELSGAVEAARQIVPPLLPQLVVVLPTASNNERKYEEREGDREQSLGFGHGEGGGSGLIVEKSNAGEVEGSSGILSGGLEAGRHIPQPLPPPLVAVLLASPSGVRKGEVREGNREDSLGVGHGEVDASGLIVEFNAREVEHSSGVLPGALEAARQIALPLPSPLVVVPAISNEEKKGEERKLDREESQGIVHGECVSSLIVNEFNAREAGSSSSELSGAMEKDVLTVSVQGGDQDAWATHGQVY